MRPYFPTSYHGMFGDDVLPKMAVLKLSLSVNLKQEVIWSNKHANLYTKSRKSLFHYRNHINLARSSSSSNN